MEFQVGDVVVLKTEEEIKRDLPKTYRFEDLFEKLAPYMDMEFTIQSFYKNGHSVQVTDKLGFSTDLIKHKQPS